MLAITFRDTKLKRISAGLSRADTVFIVCERICKLKHSICEKQNPTNSKPDVVSSNPIGVRDFFSLSVWTPYFSRANAQKALFGIFIRALITFKPIYNSKPVGKRRGKKLV